MSVGHDERGRIQGVTREALNRLLEQARTYGRKPEAIERADEFLLFKLWAAAHAREEIIRTIQSGVTSFRYVPESLQSDFRVGPITAENRFLPGLDFLHLWMDAYLLELIGVPDALAQLANVVFDLGLPVTDLGMLNNADTKLAARLLRVGGSLPTGLEEWKSKKTAWLDDLREVRNQATHRHLVRLVEIKPWDQQPPPAWSRQMDQRRRHRRSPWRQPAADRLRREELRRRAGPVEE